LKQVTPEVRLHERSVDDVECDTGFTCHARTCVLRFTGEGHPALFDGARYPALSAHAARCEALPPFREIVQPAERVKPSA
jgi:glutathione S-transferase